MFLRCMFIFWRSLKIILSGLPTRRVDCSGGSWSYSASSSVVLVASTMAPSIAVRSNKETRENRNTFARYSASLKSQISENWLLTYHVRVSRPFGSDLWMIVVLFVKKSSRENETASSSPTQVPKTRTKKGVTLRGIFVFSGFFKCKSIITNKNKIAMAPTYTIRNKNAKNSAPVYKYKITVLKNIEIKQSRLWTACFEKITPSASANVAAGKTVAITPDQRCSDMYIRVWYTAINKTAAAEMRRLTRVRLIKICRIWEGLVLNWSGLLVVMLGRGR